MLLSPMAVAPLTIALALLVLANTDTLPTPTTMLNAMPNARSLFVNLFIMKSPQIIVLNLFL